MPTFFAPKPGRFGVLPAMLNSGRINTGTLAAGTQNHNIGTYPGRAYVSRFQVTAEVFPNATTNTVTLVKYDASATADVVLSSALDINNKTANISQIGAILSTLTEAQRTLDPGDSIRIQLITTGTVTTQPDDLTINVELLVLE
jgi:hypothetical protein